MRSGVSIIDPATTQIDVDVTLAPDVTIQPGTILRGTTKVSEFSVIGPFTELTDVNVGKHAHVPHVVADSVAIADNEQISPFTVMGMNN